MMIILPRTWFIHVVVVGTFIYYKLAVSPADAAPTYNFIANQRPRFQIPHGNLSYYRSPQWEVLYYLKFGVFPFYSSSSPYLNRTQYLNRIRLIKSLMDEGKAPLEDHESAEGAEGYNDVSELSQHTTAIPEPPTLQTLNTLEESKLSKNYYYPMAQLKKNTYQLMHQPQNQGKMKHEEKRKDIIIEHPKDAPVGPQDGQQGDAGDPLSFDYFLIDGDPPSWWKHRYAKQAGMTRGLLSDGLDAGSILNGLEHGGMAAEMTIERKVGRKFQTQGWKK